MKSHSQEHTCLCDLRSLLGDKMHDLSSIEPDT
jgi:hypothetical protein